MTTPDVPHRFEHTLEVPGTPEQVWDAIATAAGISAWMMPTQLEPRVGGAVVFEMGPGETSTGRVTGFEPGHRVAYEEDWAALVGQPDADVTPLVTEFLVEAQSGGTCVVRVVTSAFGTGADWENEFWADMANGWAPMLDNLRLYLTHFPGQEASSLWAGTGFPMSPEDSIAAVRNELGAGAVGAAVSALGVTGRVERVVDRHEYGPGELDFRHFAVRLDDPVPGYLSFYAFRGGEEPGVVHVQGYLFGDGAAAYIEREQPRWQAWLEGIASEAAARPAGAEAER